MPFHIRLSDFDEVLPFWREKLWAERCKSPIQPWSSIEFDGSINLSLKRKVVHFWAATSPTGIIAGVIAAQPTSGGMLRSRGIWIEPEFREQGLGQTLIQTVKSYAAQNEFAAVWSMARRTATPFYLRMGFTWVREEPRYELGPHDVVLCPLPAN